MIQEDFSSINRGFSEQASKFDEEDNGNPILQWMRNRTRRHIEKLLLNGDKILELNAGTGLDAVYFAQKGFVVHATDLSDGMIAQIKKKITSNKLPGILSVEQLSFIDIDKTKGAPYDFVFSNFGGLNCIPSLTGMVEKLSSIINPGAYVTLVIMPPVCPWEIATVFKGNFKRAFRRFKKEGNPANLEGERFGVYYFSPAGVLKAFGDNFKLVALEGLATFVPPPHKKKFALDHPRVFKLLTGMDEKFCSYWPFNCWADHFIITLKYSPLSYLKT